MEEDRYIRITLRIPRDLHGRLDAEAVRTSKSLNAEIVARLEGSFEVAAQRPTYEEEWAQIHSLERQKNALTMRISQYQAETMHYSDRIAEVIAGVDSMDDLNDLHLKRGKARSEVYRCEREMIAIASELDALYERVSTFAPGSGRRGL